MILRNTAIRERTNIQNVDVEHGRRVANLAKQIANKAGLGKAIVNDVYEASLIHDHGKAYIDSEILNKPGSLTADEYEIIKLHSKYSAMEALSQHKNSLIVSYILHHHENYDHSGYPKRIGGEDIPIGARIIRIADFYDALISDRVYRNHYSEEEAILLMKKNAKLLDPQLFNLFLTIIQDAKTNAKCINNIDISSTN